jgi:uncharacterized protein with GYD domain
VSDSFAVRTGVAHWLNLLNGREGKAMPNYIILMKLTDQGAKTIKDAPGRVEAAIKALEKMGGKVIGFYVVMGEYDYVAVGEAPSDEVATTFSLALSSLGNVKTTTLRAYTKEQFAAMVKKLP